MKLWVDEEAVLVTNNEVDFVALYERVDLHAGLLILPQAGKREELWPYLDIALDHIEQEARAAAEASSEWILNKRVEVEPGGAATHRDLPPPTTGHLTTPGRG